MRDSSLEAGANTQVNLWSKVGATPQVNLFWSKAGATPQVNLWRKARSNSSGKPMEQSRSEHSGKPQEEEEYVSTKNTRKYAFLFLRLPTTNTIFGRFATTLIYESLRATLKMTYTCIFHLEKWRKSKKFSREIFYNLINLFHLLSNFIKLPLKELKSSL